MSEPTKMLSPMEIAVGCAVVHLLYTKLHLRAEVCAAVALDVLDEAFAADNAPMHAAMEREYREGYEHHEPNSDFFTDAPGMAFWEFRADYSLSTLNSPD